MNVFVLSCPALENLDPAAANSLMLVFTKCEDAKNIAQEYMLQTCREYKIKMPTLVWCDDTPIGSVSECSITIDDQEIKIEFRVTECEIDGETLY